MNDNVYDIVRSDVMDNLEYHFKTIKHNKVWNNISNNVFNNVSTNVNNIIETNVRVNVSTNVWYIVKINSNIVSTSVKHSILKSLL